jgi:hypothetical protein
LTFVIKILIFDKCVRINVFPAIITVAVQ